MRRAYPILFLLLALVYTGCVQAQTWDSPYYFSSNPYTANDNTCNQPPRQLLIEGGEFVIDSPFVVYRVANLFLPPPHKTVLQPWHVTLYPQFYNEELSLWVCRNHTGNNAWDCVDGSDNGPGQMNWVTVPAQIGIFYVIVAGSAFDATYPACGPYTIVAQHG